MYIVITLLIAVIIYTFIIIWNAFILIYAFIIIFTIAPAPSHAFAFLIVHDNGDREINKGICLLKWERLMLLFTHKFSLLLAIKSYDLSCHTSALFVRPYVSSLLLFIIHYPGDNISSMILTYDLIERIC